MGKANCGDTKQRWNHDVHSTAGLFSISSDDSLCTEGTRLVVGEDGSLRPLEVSPHFAHVVPVLLAQTLWGKQTQETGGNKRDNGY